MSTRAVTPFEKFRLGANYWSRAAGPRMWERFDEALVQKELAALAAIGLDCLRIFAFIPTFMPTPPTVAAAPLGHLVRFTELAAATGLGLFTTPLVGHMSGQNYGFGDEAGRSLYGDRELVARQLALLEAVVAAVAGRPNILGTILTNEMPLWGGPGTHEEIVAWAKEALATVRAADPGRPVGTGDGCMSGWPTRQLASGVDWIGPHIYYGDVDPLRHAWNTDFVIRRQQATGRPVLLEEFGASATQAGPSEQAAYLRESALSAFALGAAGALWWCASDFVAEAAEETPYSHHAFELGFGLLDAGGGEKPVCDELRALRQLVDREEAIASIVPPRQAALVVSDWLERPFPFSWEDKGGLRRAALQAFVLASQAGLDVDVVDEDDDLSRYALLLVPATQKLKVPTWRRLEAAARAGATVYWSYFSGENEFHQGAWCPSFETLTGLRHRLRYGCFDLPGERLHLKGELSLSLPTGQAQSTTPASLARLPITPLAKGSVESLAVSQDGELALSLHHLGSGKVIFCAYPIERYLMSRADGSELDAHRLYRLLGEEAGIEERYPSHHASVQVRVRTTGSDDLVIVQHRGWHAAVDDAAEIPGEAELLYDRGNPSPRTLGPKGARVWRVRSVRPAAAR